MWTLDIIIGGVLFFVAVQLLIGLLHSVASDLEDPQDLTWSTASTGEPSDAWG